MPDKNDLSKVVNCPSCQHPHKVAEPEVLYIWSGRTLTSFCSECKKSFGIERVITLHTFK